MKAGHKALGLRCMLVVVPAPGQRHTEQRAAHRRGINTTHPPSAAHHLPHPGKSRREPQAASGEMFTPSERGWRQMPATSSGAVDSDYSVLIKCPSIIPSQDLMHHIF